MARERADLIPQLAEIFREYGFEGTSLALVTERTGLGKGSLYNFFHGGKTEMAQAVLDDIQAWFESHIFKPLLENHDLAAMLDSVETYFAQGGRVCLLGIFALTETRDAFALTINDYFERWEACLVSYFEFRGEAEAQLKAADILVTIQGALTLSRARNNPAYFVQAMQRLRQTYLR